MSTYKNEQRRIVFRGRHFHFVSYDGHPANVRRGESAEPPMWYLMGPGKRWPVFEQVQGQPEEETERALLKWLREQDFGKA